MIRSHVLHLLFHATVFIGAFGGDKKQKSRRIFRFSGCFVGSACGGFRIRCRESSTVQDLNLRPEIMSQMQMKIV
jgi:hypothetical protein